MNQTIWGGGGSLRIFVIYFVEQLVNKTALFGKIFLITDCVTAKASMTAYNK